MNWIKSNLEISRGATNNLSAMEGLRGFAVFLVFLVHYTTLIAPWLESNSSVESIARTVHAIGNVGVDLFFVLSGYLIYGALIVKARPFLRFMVRRIERIYPTFTVVLLAYIVLSLGFPAESKIPHDIDKALYFLLANFLLLPGLFDIRPIITVAWSLSYEMLYYLLIPLIVSLLRLHNWSSGRRIVLFLMLGLVLALYFMWNGGHVRMLMFLSGILLWEAWHGLKLRSPSSISAFICLICALGTTQLPGDGPSFATLRVLLLCAFFLGLCFTCFAQPQGWIARMFSWSPMRWLGNISYSYYLIHGLMLKFVFMLFDRAWPADQTATGLFFVLLLPAFLVTLVPAFGLFALIERPFSLKRKGA